MSRAEPLATDTPPARARPSAWGRASLAAVAAASGLVANLPCLFYPLARDQGIFAYNTAALLQGAVPYRDFVDQKPPGILFFYMIPLASFGPAAWGIHLFEWLVLGATGLVVFLVGRRLAGDGAGIVAAAGCALFHSPAVHDFWDRAQIESFLTLAYGAVFLLLAGVRPPRQRGLLAGLFAGLIGGACFCLKPNAAGFPLAAVAALALIDLRHRDFRGTAARCAAFAAGFAAPPAALIGWLAATGGSGPFLEHALSVNTPYVGSGLRITALRLAYGIAPVAGGVAVACGLLALLARRFARGAYARIVESLGAPPERDRHLALFAATWIGCVATFVSGRFLFAYHAQALILPNALTLGLAAPALGLVRAASPSGTRRVRIAAWAALLVPALIVAATLPPEDRAFLTGRMLLDDYQGTARFDQGDFSYREDRALARAIASRTGPGETVQIFGHGSLALFLAGRASATRFSFTPAAMDPRYGRGGADREEILARLQANPPPLVAITSNDPLIQFGVAASDEQVRSFPPLAAFLSSRYRPVARLGDHLLLERRDRATTAGARGPLDSPATTP